MDSHVPLSLDDRSRPKDLQIVRSAEVTKSVYSALQYTQLINYILRNFMKPFKEEDVLRSAAVMDEKESKFENTSMT
jgi:hypothetical protein